MGRNLARNFARNGYAVAVHNRSHSRTEALVKEFGGEGTFLPSEDVADFVASLKRPRRAIIMVKAGAGTDAVIDQLADLMGAGRHDRRRRQRPLRGHQAQGGGAARARHPLRRHRHLGRRGGRAARPEHHAGRLP
ncbi:NAD(P)-binding domain-containing protein [Nonomuraea dietziae]|uniref:NAD(P)-binding domain-containing protein n=1 Tax=Nonomuraea dietziae TaxID=65515 RepID=UPI003CD05A3C